MKRIASIIALHCSLWHGLLAVAGIILVYLTGVHISEALNTSALFTFFNTGHAVLTWEPSHGTVDHYLLEITDTHLLNGRSGERNRLTATRYETSVTPRFSLQCVHNHSYRVRVKAVSPDGASSDYSEPSILFICDREPPTIELAALPSSSLHKVRSQHIMLSGSFDEPHMDTLMVNDATASIDHRSNTFSCALTLAPGDNVIEVYARDLAGNSSTDRSIITYAPITIVSVPANAQLHWNGNYAYPGSYGGTAPRSYRYAGTHKQTLRVSLAGFYDFFGIIDFSDQSRDTYVISLTPHVPSDFSQLNRITNDAAGPLPVSFPHPFVVDFNLDGHKDMLVGNADGTVSLMLNRGRDDDPFSDPRALETEVGPIDVGTNAAPFMLDYDNNGTFDLLVGSGDGYLYCYSNRGDNTVPSFSAPSLITGLDGRPLHVESDCSPWVSDWNGDRRKDLLLGSGNGTCLLAINVGSDSAPVFDPLRPLQAGGRPIEAAGPTAPCVIDWNADGHLDVLMGAGDGSIHVYYAEAGSNEPELSEGSPIQAHGQPLVLEGALAPFPVDWNGDGEHELVLGRDDGGMYLLD